MTRTSAVSRHRAAPTADASPKRRKLRAPGGGLWEASPLTYFALIIGIVLSIFPIVWTMIVASRDNDSIYSVPPAMLPGGNFFDNITRALENEQAALTYGLMNSVLVSGTVTFSVVFFSSLAGFAFAKLRFRGRNALLLLMIMTMMVPVQLGFIPLYILMIKLGWHGELKAVILPFLVSGFGVFLMRQYTASAVSDELIEAARVDGCSTWRTYWNVILPAVRPAAAVLGLLTFMQTWNEFLWPYLVLTPDKPTVTYSLKILAAANYSTDYTQIFAGTALATLPLIFTVLIFGKQIIGGLMEGSVKA